jgi:nucleoside-diphosphate-sugar epimerase
MKALVTGGAGFIGSHLAEALVRQGAEVVALDNLSTGSADNLAWARPGDKLEFVAGDAGDEALLRRLLPRCQWVFHQAAVPSVPWSVAEPVKSNEQNLGVAVRLLAAAREAGVKRVLFASSSAVYGDSDVLPKHEELPPRPLSPYGLQKYAAETYGRLFHRLYGLETVALRYFNVFGPRQSFNSHYSGVVARFCTAAVRGEPPVIFGDGLQSRDFVYVANVVQANLLAAQAPAARVAGQVFNVAGGVSISLLDLVAELGRLTGRPFQPRFEPPRLGDVRASWADVTRLQQAAGFRLEVPWQEGLARTLAFYREENESAS